MTMKVLVLVLSLGAVLARPDVSHLSNAGYHYKPPTNSYGVPIDNGHGESTHQHHHHEHHHVPTGSYLPAGLQVPLADSQVNFLGGNSGSSGHQGGYGFNNQLIQDQKHVYYYAVPDEEEHTRLRIHIAPNNQKNTNVIFVKAPSYGPVIPEVIAPQSQAEEKTKVFVLVKKPEHPGQISIQAPTPVKTKPEVYVVKYNNQHEAEQAISGGRGGYPLGANVHQVGDERAFIKVLESDASHHVPHNDKYSGFDGNVDAFAGKAVLYGAPATGAVNSFASRSSFGSDGSSSNGGSGSADFSSVHTDSGIGSSGVQGVSGFSSVDSGKGSTFELSSQGGNLDGSSGSGFSSQKGSTFELGSTGSQGGNLGGSVDFSSAHTDSGKTTTFDLGSGSQGGSSSSSNLNSGSAEGSSLLAGLSGSTGSDSEEFSTSGKGDGFNSQIGSSLDTLKISGDSGKTLSSSSFSSDNSQGSTNFGSRGSFVGGEGSSVSSSFPSSDSNKSGGSFTKTFEISGSSHQQGKEFGSPVLAALTGGSQGTGSSSSSFEFSGSKTSDIGSGSVGVRHGDSSGDFGSSSTGTFSVKSGHATYGPPGLSGPY